VIYWYDQSTGVHPQSLIDKAGFASLDFRIRPAVHCARVIQQSRCASVRRSVCGEGCQIRLRCHKMTPFHQILYVVQRADLIGVE